jgi:hypothetical protein
MTAPGQATSRPATAGVITSRPGTGVAGRMAGRPAAPLRRSIRSSLRAGRPSTDPALSRTPLERPSFMSPDRGDRARWCLMMARLAAGAGQGAAGGNAPAVTGGWPPPAPATAPSGRRPPDTTLLCGHRAATPSRQAGHAGRSVRCWHRPATAAAARRPRHRKLLQNLPSLNNTWLIRAPLRRKRSDRN